MTTTQSWSKNICRQTFHVQFILVWRVPRHTLTVIGGGMQLCKNRPQEALFVCILHVDDGVPGSDIRRQLHKRSTAQWIVRDRYDVEMHE